MEFVAESTATATAAQGRTWRLFDEEMTNTKLTIASIFTGGGLVEIGAKAAGLVPLWGIESVDKIAQATGRILTK